MAVADPTTPNYNLPLKVHGHAALANTVKQGFEIIDAKMKQLQDQLDNIAAASNDSNSLHINLTDSNSQFGDDTP